MPFKSVKQRRFLHKYYPDIANKWEKEYGTPENLPEHARRKQQKFHKRKSKIVFRIPR